MDDVTLIHGDCLAEMPKLPSASFDMICADLPYGTTACSWDVVIPFEPLWAEYKRLIKPRGAIVLFGSQPFTSLLVCSNLAWFKYAWVWDKVATTNHLNSRHQPLRVTEDVCVFANGKTTYNPQLRRKPLGDARPNNIVVRDTQQIYGATRELHGRHEFRDIPTEMSYPINLLRISQPVGSHEKKRTVHPTQKPVVLLEYLILTYTNEGEAVLDNTMGSGTTMVACIQTGRTGTGIELRWDYFETAEERCRKSRLQAPLLSNNGFHLTAAPVGLWNDDDLDGAAAGEPNR